MIKKNKKHCSGGSAQGDGPSLAKNQQIFMRSRKSSVFVFFIFWPQ